MGTLTSYHTKFDTWRAWKKESCWFLAWTIAATVRPKLVVTKVHNAPGASSQERVTSRTRLARRDISTFPNNHGDKVLTKKQVLEIKAQSDPNSTDVWIDRKAVFTAVCSYIKYLCGCSSKGVDWGHQDTVRLNSRILGKSQSTRMGSQC